MSWGGSITLHAVSLYRFWRGLNVDEFGASTNTEGNAVSTSDTSLLSITETDTWQKDVSCIMYHVSGLLSQGLVVDIEVGQHWLDI